MENYIDILTRLIPPNPPAFYHGYNIVIILFCSIALMWMLPFLPYVFGDFWKRISMKHERLKLYQLKGRRIQIVYVHPLLSLIGLLLGIVFITQGVYHLTYRKAAIYAFPHNLFWEAFCVVIILIGILLIGYPISALISGRKNSYAFQNTITLKSLRTAKELLQFIGRLPTLMAIEAETLENRQFVRRSYDASAIKCRLEENFTEEIIRDISLGGMFVSSRKKFLYGQKITLLFLSESSKRFLSLEGQVARIEKNGIGVSFLYCNS